MIGNRSFLTGSIKHPGARVRQTEQFKQRSLLNFVLNAFIGVITGKGAFAHGVEKVGIKSRRVINFVRPADEFGLLRAVIGKI